MSKDFSEALYWIALKRILGWADAGYRKLLIEFGSPQNIFSAGQAALTKVVASDYAASIAAGVNEADFALELNWLAEPGNHLLTLADSNYPQLLLQIPDPPPLLYIKGRPEILNHPAIAVVGSRNATVQGLKDARAFAHVLSDAGLTIISGLALGIDGAAHSGGLGGAAKTIAVCGTGLDVVYPARHRDLAHDIAAEGALLSEFPLGTPAKAHNFPRRNRLISGMAQGCLVIEAAQQSGSLITARLAADQGREVFALPGSIHSPLAKGCHALIKQGAKLVDSAQDILEELKFDRTGAVPLEEKSAHRVHPLFAHLGYGAMDINSLAEQSGLAIEDLTGILLTLELEGQVAALPGGLYQRIY